MNVGALSSDVRGCGLDALVSCPGIAAISGQTCPATASEGNAYCACGYRGPLCSDCDSGYFTVWTKSGRCEKCSRGQHHTPTVILGLAVLLGVLALAATCVQRVKQSFPMVKNLYRIGAVKVRVLFFAAQVISEFTTISSSTGSSRYPEPASAFASGLGLTNLNAFGLVPIECFFNDNFYNRLLMKTTAPFIIVALLWSYPAVEYLRGKDHSAAAKRAARVSLLVLELICPSTTSTIMRTFVCERFENGHFLRASLTLPCDNSHNRRWWKAYAIIMIAAYPVGVPLLLFCLLFPHRAEIKLMLTMIGEHDVRRGTVTSMSELRVPSSRYHRASFVNHSMKLMWLLPKVKKFKPSCWRVIV